MGEGRAESRYRGVNGGAEAVLPDDLALGDALGPGCQRVLLGNFIQHLGTDGANGAAGSGKAEDDEWDCHALHEFSQITPVDTVEQHILGKHAHVGIACPKKRQIHAQNGKDESGDCRSSKCQDGDRIISYRILVCGRIDCNRDGDQILQKHGEQRDRHCHGQIFADDIPHIGLVGKGIFPVVMGIVETVISGVAAGPDDVLHPESVLDDDRLIEAIAFTHFLCRFCTDFFAFLLELCDGCGYIVSWRQLDDKEDDD